MFAGQAFEQPVVQVTSEAVVPAVKEEAPEVWALRVAEEASGQVQKYKVDEAVAAALALEELPIGRSDSSHSSPVAEAPKEEAAAFGDVAEVPSDWAASEEEAAETPKDEAAAFSIGAVKALPVEIFAEEDAAEAVSPDPVLAEIELGLLPAVVSAANALPAAVEAAAEAPMEKAAALGDAAEAPPEETAAAHVWHQFDRGLISGLSCRRAQFNGKVAVVMDGTVDSLGHLMVSIEVSGALATNSLVLKNRRLDPGCLVPLPGSGLT
jgi:hypothetical protein